MRHQKNIGGQDRSVEGESISDVSAAEVSAMGDEFIRCTFSGLDLSNAKLTGKKFEECEFIGCNLALANISGTSLQSVHFTECKMIGVRFDLCNAFLLTVSFEGCILDRASFYKLKVKKTVFTKCRMKETDLSECDLSGSVFDLCDMEGAVFDRTNIEKADLRTSYHYSIDLGNNRITKAKFSTSGIAGLLDAYDIIIE
jgi:fluoroquinolone resistance protein